MIERTLQQAQQRRQLLCICGGFDTPEQGLRLMAQGTHRMEARHSRTPLQGMQGALQFCQWRRVAQIGTPCRQGCIRQLQQFGGLLSEDAGDLRIDHLRNGRTRRHFRHGRQNFGHRSTKALCRNLGI